MSTQPLNADAILAAIFDPQLTPADLPAKTGLSLPELARWFRANADTVNQVREFLTQRASLIATRVHASSLGALDRVLRESPDLERVRKAASTVLRSLKPPTNPTRERGAQCVPEPAQRSNMQVQQQEVNRPLPPPREQAQTKRPAVSDRLAAMRLAKLRSLPPASGLPT